MSAVPPKAEVNYGVGICLVTGRSRVDGVARRVIQAPKPEPRIMRHELTDYEWEPISKSSEEDNEAGELDKAEEVLSVVLPADEDATLPLYPGEEPLDEPASRVTA